MLNSTYQQTTLQDEATTYDSLVQNKFPTVFQNLGNLGKPYAIQLKKHATPHGEPYAIQLKKHATPHAIYSAQHFIIPLLSKVTIKRTGKNGDRRYHFQS